MADSFTEVTSTSWFSRIGGAIKGIIVGAIMVLIAFPVLFFNEQRAVNTSKGLEDGAKNTVSISADKVDPANEGKLVHLTSPAKTTDKLQDPATHVSAPALVLRRRVEMYQWKEIKKETTKKNVGGSETKTTEYSYEKTWSDAPIDSSQFNVKGRDDHMNLPMPLRTEMWTASPITVGAFTLPSALAAKISPNTPLPASESWLAGLPPTMATAAKVEGSNVYVGTDSKKPELGDVRISYMMAPNELPVSLVAQQHGPTFEPYHTKTNTTIEMLRPESISAAGMFALAQSENATLTWILRLVGFILFFIGFISIFKPLSVVADVLPFLGSLVGMGTGLLAFLLALCLSTLTIAVSWVVVRPMVGIPLLIVSIAAMVAIVQFRKKRAVVAPVPA